MTMTAHAKRHITVRTYVLSWLALLALTALTLVLARTDLGSFNVPVALVIASTKATVVALLFMHLWEQSSVLRLVLIVAFFYVLVLVVFTVADLATRESGRAFPLGTTTSGAPVGPRR